MKQPRNWTFLTCLIVFLCTSVYVLSQRDHKSDKRGVLGTNYKITGIIEPEAGQSFPRSWGRLVVVHAIGMNRAEQFFVFEAENGTIRIVKTDLNWNNRWIDDAAVITIGRN